jgi:uncharacterized protein YneF (UPF0154 family)
VIASVWVTVSEHVFSFVGGVVVGFYLTGRYQIIKRKGDR